MGRQSIDTNRVMATAQKLRTVNRNIGDAFSTMQRTAKGVERDWNSRAGALAQTALYSLFQNNASRAAVLQNYINFLEQSVAHGYVNAEDVNKKLADQFR